MSKLHENIAGIASNIGQSEAYSIIIDNSLTDGWVGLMRSIVCWADLFTKTEEVYVDDSFDWYSSVDAFTNAISKHIVTEGKLPEFHQLGYMAKSAMTFHNTPHGDDVCDTCMRSDVEVYRVDEDGKTICVDCESGLVDGEKNAEAV